MGNENFKAAVKKLAIEYSNLDWMDEETCPDFDTALDALEAARSCGVAVRDYSISEDMQFAIDCIDEAHEKDRHWQPTPEEIRECCGTYYTAAAGLFTIEPFKIGNREYFNDLEDFRECAERWTKIEQIPEQCIPKPAVTEERYLVRYPLLAGIF